MQDVEKDSVSTSIKFAASFLSANEASSLSELVDALQRVYVYRSLGLNADVSDEQSANRLIRIALPIESQLYHMKGQDDAQMIRAYSLVASIFEYAARVNASNPAESKQYWLRASLAYLQAKKSANSIVCANRARLMNIDTDPKPKDETLDLVLRFLSRDIVSVLESAHSSRQMLENKVVNENFQSVMEQAKMLGILDLVTSIQKVSEYLQQGISDSDSGSRWSELMRNALAHFQESGDDYFVWLTSRLIRSIAKLQENAFWNLKNLLSPKLIEAFTNNKEQPIYDLWDNQLIAIGELLQADAKRHYSLIMPTSAGKMVVGAIIAANELLKNPGNCFYVTPFRALVSEVAEFLNRYLPDMGINVSYLPGKYDAIPQLETLVGNTGRIYVLTPEKLDLLWRTSDSRLKDSAVFIFDEIQNITEEGRGLRFELLVSRIKKAYGHHSRILLLSATIPEMNLPNLVDWLGSKNSSASKINLKPTRTLEAIFWRAKMESLRGDIHYIDKFNIRGILPPRGITTRREDAADLALKYEKNLGPVLVYCNSRSEAEQMAALISKKSHIVLEDQDSLQTTSDYVRAIMGPNYPLWEMMVKGIAYHHSSLPDSVKKSIEQLARVGTLRVICCTSTLAEGVNLNVGTVIISSTYQGEVLMDGLKLRNLAGRAGRALKETEGHVLLMDAAAQESLTEEAYSIFESRFFQYLSALTGTNKFDTDVDAIESDLLARFYKHELITEQLDEGTKQLLESTLFYRQANVNQYKSALASLQDHAKRISNFIPNLNDSELKVFAETGLGIRHCQVLNERAKGFAQDPNMKFRKADGINWEKIDQLIDACLLPSSRYGTRIQQVITEPVHVIHGWLSAKSILGIAASMESIPSSKVLTAVSSFLYGYITDDVSWACAAMIKLIDRSLAEEAKLNLDYEFYLLPNYLKYGVNNPCALLLSLAGIEDRELANRISSNFEMADNKVDWLRIIAGVLDNSEPALKTVKSNLLASLGSFSLEIAAFSGKPGSCGITETGKILQGQAVVGELLEPYLPLLKVMETRECSFVITAENDKATVQISPA